MSFSICPIGGLGQIGSNMMEITCESGSFIIDCGILFPYEDTFEIRYLIPNFENLQRPQAIIITHGHEDHIGALAHLVEKFPDILIYAPPFAAQLIKNKFEFFPRKLKFKLSTKISETIPFGNIEVDYIQVNHSIPDTFGIFLKNKDTGTCVFYISDFKVDDKNKHEPYFDFKKLEKLSKGSPKKILMADSTNITSRQTKTHSENDLLPSLDKYLQSNHQRVFITTFSSNIHRLKNIYESSKNANRKVVLYGRSMKNYWQTAFDVGIVESPDVFYDCGDVDVNKDRLTIIVSGCQGDFRSTFRRVSFGQDSFFKPNERDIFLLSSKAIPGNEKKISLCLNELSRFGTEVVTSGDDLIHASGHAGKEDLEIVFDNFKPDVYIAIHGEGFFLERHNKWILTKNKNIKSFKILNFNEFNFESNITGQREEQPPKIILGKAIEFSRDAIKERRKIAEGGYVGIVVVGNKSGLLDFKCHVQGISYPETYPEDHFLKNIEMLIRKNYRPNGNFSEEVRIKSRKLFVDLIGVKPVVKVTTSIV